MGRAGTACITPATTIVSAAATTMSAPSAASSTPPTMPPRIRPTLKPRKVSATPLDTARGGTRSLTMEMNAGAPSVWNVDITHPNATRTHSGQLARARRPVATMASPAPASESTTMTLRSEAVREQARVEHEQGERQAVHERRDADVLGRPGDRQDVGVERGAEDEPGRVRDQVRRQEGHERRESQRRQAHPLE